MSLFGKKETAADRIANMHFADPEPEQPAVNYDTVLEYLTGLDAREYKKVCDVADIYREAHAKAAKILGIKNEPLQSLKDELQTVPPVVIKSDDDITDAMLDDDLSAAFLETPPKAAKAKKVEVKDANTTKS